MKSRKTVALLISISFFLLSIVNAQEKAVAPVTKNASPEARALLKFFYSISGEYLLSGQHNYPNVQGRNTQFSVQYTGRTPVIYGTDWGFAQDSNTDSYHARQDIVNEAIRQNKLGAIVTICWHAVPPTANEPVTFQPKPGADSTKLASVQGRLLDQQFKDVLTPGTALYKHWAEQVDSIAFYLKELQDAHVPILWRPYHEMNGDWFWWGGRQGEYSTARLYRQLFDRLVNHHHLNNLIWIWSVDRPSRPDRLFSKYYPGNEYLDMLSLDVYGSDFNQLYYDSLLALSKGKPVALAEVGNPPTPDVIKLQPKWTYYMIWAGMVRNTLKAQYDKLYSDSHVLTQEDEAYRIAIASYRATAGLPALTAAHRINDFSGHWVFDEEKSELGNTGSGNLAAKLDLQATEDALDVKRTLVSEFAESRTTEEKLMLNGEEQSFKPEFGNAPRMVKARRSEKGDSLYIDTRVNFTNNSRTVEWTTHETWALKNNGRVLVISQASNAFFGKRSVVAVYDKE
ncbi:MAG TPA: glycosyl hydrolase [Puia sp.]|nr:glycosyl hydrolase [Puia sp.]